MTSEQEKISFFVGSGRCGSSVVHEVICRHESVVFVSNLDDRVGRGIFTRRNLSQMYRDLPPSVTQKGRLRLAPSEGYRALGREVSPMISVSHRDLIASDATPYMASSFREFFDRRWSGKPETHLVHKFTGWPRVGFLDAVYPDAKFVHVVRDGRAVVNSWLKTSWWPGYGGPETSRFGSLTDEERETWEANDESYAVLAALEWRRLVTAASTSGQKLGDDRFLEVRYEDFLSDPQHFIDNILTFLELGDDPGFEERLKRLPVEKSRADAYVRDLGTEVVGQLSEILGPTLSRYGYDS